MTPSRNSDLLIEEHLPGALFSCEHHGVTTRGKVRDLIEQRDTIIMINTDRISAFDCVLGTIPLKGALLCAQAHHWFKALEHIVPHHVIDRPDPQIMVVKKAEPFLVEVVVRGYIAGSLMRESPDTRGQNYGLALDPHLKNYERLSHPIITPSTKAPKGQHDQPISAAEIIARNIVPQKIWDEIVSVATALFVEASVMAEKNGLVLVNTKYEFGLIHATLHLIDEVHTSDSSRFFLKNDYHEKFPQGHAPVMLDKEFLRQHLLAQGLTPESDFTGVTLDDGVRIEVAKRYLMLTEAMTGREFIAPEKAAQLRVPGRLAELIC